MAKNKTDFTTSDVQSFIETVENVQKKEDSYTLIQLMEKISGEKATMYGPSIIGFGKYEYVYESGHSGVAPVLGFSPRKSAISLYVYYSEQPEEDELLKKLGKFTMGKSCIYVKKLSDIDENILIELMKKTINRIEKKYTRIKA